MARLRHAAVLGDWNELLSAARENPADLLAVDDESGFTALHYAVSSNAPLCVIQQLLESSEGKLATLVRCREGGWTPLHLSCRAIASDEVILCIARQKPAVIAKQDDDGDNGLHCALRNGASDLVLQTLITLASSAGSDGIPIQTADYGDGDWPIHAAIRHEAPVKIVEALITTSPQSIVARNCECKAPLHLACEFERHDVIALLVNRLKNTMGTTGFRSYLSTEDWFGYTPIWGLWERYVDSVVVTSEEDIRAFTSQPRLDVVETVEQIEAWESIILMIQSAWYGEAVNLDPRCRRRSQIPLLIHGVLGLGSTACPPSLLDFLVKRYPLVLSTPDSEGRLPLHEAIVMTATPDKQNVVPSKLNFDGIICSPRPLTDGSCTSLSPLDEEHGHLNAMMQKSLAQAAVKIEEHHDVHGSSARQDASSTSPSEFSSLVGVLINAYPRAALEPDIGGKLPLALAASSGLTWSQGTEQVFAAAPSILRKRDPSTGLFPFMLAATAEVKDEITLVDNIFRLLRLEPSLVGCGTLGTTNGATFRGLKRVAENPFSARKKKCL